MLSGGLLGNRAIKGAPSLLTAKLPVAPKIINKNI
jgi:hypothetical protein